MTSQISLASDGMKNTSLFAELQACNAPAQSAFSLPPRCYWDPEVLALEVERIFRNQWIGIGRTSRFERPGDYETHDIAGLPLIVLRDKENQIRVFANSCRHRGARLLEGQGHCRGIRCPFHCWSYALDGRLVGTPHMERAEGFQRADYGLIEFQAADIGGFLFICLDQQAVDIDRHLGDFAARHADWPLDSLVVSRRRCFEVGCNWKAFLEVFNEYYHLPFVHPTSIAGVYSPPEAPDVTTGAYASQFGVTEGTGALLDAQQAYALPPMPDLKGRAATGVRYSWVFPNMTFAAGTDSLWIYEAYPLDPDRCHVVQSICFHRDTVARPDFEEIAAQYYHRFDAALAEDLPALENQHRGLKSPFAQQGRFEPNLEPNVAAFARWYAERLS
ncbi:MAG: aromatic ring-hydroxylating dioxygenase subunit alpha [Pseudomonadota bacterium]